MTPPAELVDAGGAGPLPCLEFVSGAAAGPSSFIDGSDSLAGMQR